MAAVVFHFLHCVADTRLCLALSLRQHERNKHIYIYICATRKVNDLTISFFAFYFCIKRAPHKKCIGLNFKVNLSIYNRIAHEEIRIPNGETNSGYIIHIDERDFSTCPIPSTIADISSGRTGGRARLNCNKNEVGSSPLLWAKASRAC